MCCAGVLLMLRELLRRLEFGAIVQCSLARLMAVGLACMLGWQAGRHWEFFFAYVYSTRHHHLCICWLSPCRSMLLFLYHYSSIIASWLGFVNV